MTCTMCRKTFPSLEDYLVHRCCNAFWNVPGKIRPKYHYMTCEKCNSGFPSFLAYSNHRCHPPKKPKMDVNDHEDMDIDHRESPKKNNQVGRGRRQSLGGHAQQEIFKPENDSDLLQEMQQQENHIRQHLIAKLNHGMKWYIIVFAEFKKDVVAADGTITEQKREDYLSSQTFTTYNQTDIDMDLPTAYKDLFTKFDEQERQGSGWYLSKIIHIEVHTATLSPLAASSFIELPKKVKRTEAVINIKNEDNMCFIWSVLAHLHPMDRHANRVNKYQPFQQELNSEGMDFPTPIHQIPDFEKKNNVSINVFGWEEKEVVPVQLSRHESETVINLLLISEDDKRHYCLIKNFSRLMNYRTKHKGKSFFCMNCLHDFTRQDLLDKHREVCTKHGAQRLSFPEDTAVKFKSIAKQQRVPFCIYADFECCTVKQEGDKYQHHEPNSFAYKVVSEYEQWDPVLYRGDNVVETFFDHMNKERDRIVKRLEKIEPIVMTPEDEKDFDEATDCYICHELMGADRVRDHDHVSGKYRGAAHSECNLQFRLRKDQQSQKDSFYISVFFSQFERV